MATSFPNSTQTFPQMIDLTASDGALAQQYQAAMQAGNLTLAKQILAQIPDNQNKIITADYLNTISDTVVAVEQYFGSRYSPAYIVSESQPAYQEATDFWFEVTDGTIEPSEGVVVFSADFSGLAPSAAQFYSWEGRIFDNAIYDDLQNIQCADGVAMLTSVYDSSNSRWTKQMMCTAGLFEADNFTCTFKAKFSGLAGSWQNVITYGAGTHWTDGTYSDGVKWPAGGEIDAFEQAGGFQETPNTINLTAHWGSGSNSGYPDTHERKSTGTVEFTTDAWHDFKFSLKNGYVKIWIDDVLVGENDFSDCLVSNNYLADYAPFLKPQAFYIDGSCASGSIEINTDNVYKFEVSDFKVYQDKDIPCTALEIYPQMWPQGTELIFPVGAELYLERVYTPENTSNKACTWVSSNPSVATVEQGYVKVLAEGTTTIMATCGTASAQYILTASSKASIPCAKLKANQESITLSVGDTYDIRGILFKYPSFSTEEISYVVDSDLISISDGVITANAVGDSIVEVACGNRSLALSVSVVNPAAPLIDTTFDTSVGGKSDTLVGGLTDGQTYTAIWVLTANPKYVEGGTRALTSSFYSNKAPGIQVVGGTLQVVGREKISYNINLGTAAEGMEIRAVFTVGGTTNFYVNGELKYTGTSNISSSYFPVGTDTWIINSILADCRYTLARCALYSGEYLGALN